VILCEQGTGQTYDTNCTDSFLDIIKWLPFFTKKVSVDGVARMMLRSIAYVSKYASVMRHVRKNCGKTSIN